jgi:dipeptidyl aminopeptidase/acylaminoacyl peptidase
VVTASEDKTARKWEAATGKEIAKLEGHTDEVKSSSFSPDGRRVVTASRDGTARIWDAATGKEIAKLKGHTGGVLSSSFSPDGRRVLTGSGGDRTARIWDAETGKAIAKLEGAAYSPSFSPDGRRVLTEGEKTACVWDVELALDPAKMEAEQQAREQQEAKEQQEAAREQERRAAVENKERTQTEWKALARKTAEEAIDKWRKYAKDVEQMVGPGPFDRVKVKYGATDEDKKQALLSHLELVGSECLVSIPYREITDEGYPLSRKVKEFLTDDEIKMMMEEAEKDVLRRLRN